MDTVAPYLSDDESSSPNTLPSTSTQRNRKPTLKRKWSRQQTFQNKDEATIFISKEEMWSFWYKNQTSIGAKSYYRCNRVKQKGTQCEAGLYLLYDNTSLEVHLYKAENSHTCSEPTSRGLSAKAKTEIEALLELRLMPKLIFEKLHEKGLAPKNRTQVCN